MDDLFGDLWNPEDRDISDAAEGEVTFEQSLKTSGIHHIERGVSTVWLSQAFGMPKTQVERKLAGCPVLKGGQNGAKIYDFKKAVDYLAKPRMSVEKYVHSLKPTELPTALRSEIWSARLKEQKARLNAENLWLTEDVQAAFGDVFKQIKDTAILWADTIEESVGLTDEQRGMIDDLVRELLSEVGNSIASYCKKRRTSSQVVEFEEDLNVS